MLYAYIIDHVLYTSLFLLGNQVSYISYFILN